METRQEHLKSYEIKHQNQFIKMVMTLVLNKVVLMCRLGFYISDFHGYKSYLLPKCTTISYITIIYLTTSMQINQYLIQMSCLFLKKKWLNIIEDIIAHVKRDIAVLFLKIHKMRFFPWLSVFLLHRWKYKLSKNDTMLELKITVLSQKLIMFCVLVNKYCSLLLSLS